MRTRRGIGALAAAACGVAASGSDFTHTNQFGNSHTIPIAWRDCDGDGDLDLAVGNYGEQNELYVNQGDGMFARQTPFGSGNTFAVSWADFDNDGDADLAVGGIGQNRLYVNEAGTFTLHDTFGGWRTIALAWADFDLDGDLDLAIGNGILGVAEQNYLYVNHGDNTFEARPEFGQGQSCSLAWGDCDNDGDPDLAVGNGGFGYVGQNYLYVNQGDGSFVGHAEFGLGDTASVAWGDCDNDGWLDLAVGNWNMQMSYLYVNFRDGTFGGVPVFGPHDTNTLAWGDWDLDGDSDLAFGNGDFTSAGQNYLYHNDGLGTFTAEPQFGLGSTDSVAWGDADNDGDLDLAVGNEHSPTQNWLYVNDLPPAPGLRLHLVGQFHLRGVPYSNRDAIGARVALYPAGFAGEPFLMRGYRQIEALGGFSSQNAPDPTFGLPADPLVDIVIQWPGSGGGAITQVLRSVPTGQLLTVVEALAGDLNCDGAVGFADINALVLALSNPAAYETQYPGCNRLHGDVNGDGVVGFGDINPFVALLAGG